MTTPIGVIPKDELLYHGTHPFSKWGATWKRLYSDLPVDAAYAIYDQHVRVNQALPVPPLKFVNDWQDQHFRVMRREGDDKVVALLRIDGQFFLIGASVAAYEKWAEKLGLKPFVFVKE